MSMMACKRNHYVDLYQFLCLLLQDVVRKIEGTKTNPGDKPAQEIKIADSGSIPVETPYAVDKKPSKE